jgi:small subunit ribosomal protein S20
MPIIKRAIKKLHHDRKRTSYNAKTKANLRTVVKDMRKKPSQKTLTVAYKSLDKAVKTKIIHANKAARLKSRLSKLLKQK